ncbi:MAG: bifunctional phosphoglucose/phosphomannose isomerase [Ignavibacteriaceae bacterium]
MKISEYVKKYDPQNQFEVLINSYQQIEFAWDNKIDLLMLKNKRFNSIIVTGLGGSAISADLMQNFLHDEIKIPFIVNRSYNLPVFVNENTLVVVSSYSGNTEETLSVFEQALKTKCSIVCISTGGKVDAISIERKIPVVKVKPGFQPRYALGISLFSLLKIFQELLLIENQNEIVKKIIKLWREKGVEYSKEENIAYDYAKQLIGFIPTIYSAVDLTSAVGYRLKCQFNENSKLHAFCNIIPEMNHNEIIGWESFSEKQFHTKIINILDKDYDPQIKKRFDITSELASKKGVEIINLKSEEDNFKVRLMDLIYLCDWITYYAAVLRGFDPTEIENINILKERLA